ncbi:MAG: hypothetical protein M1405_03285 [Patescibacteria group bacterium]|nr:hypothetical protein [Patescibacteria group bacterium]
MKAIIALVVFLLLHLIAPKAVFAARSLIISSDKTSLFGYEDATITASASGFTDGELIYIKGAFYQDGSTNYFGYTKNGDNWIKNGDSTTSQKQIKIGDWDNKIVVESDFLDSGYKGESGYKFKVGFYYITSGGNLSSVNWSSNSLDINLNEPDPAPTPTPISQNTPTLTPAPTKSPTPPLNAANATPKPLTPKPAVLPTKTSLSENVLGEASESATMSSLTKPLASKVPKKEKIISSAKEDNLGKILIILGFVFILACGILFSWPFIRKKLKKDEW